MLLLAVAVAFLSGCGDPSRRPESTPAQQTGKPSEGPARPGRSPAAAKPGALPVHPGKIQYPPLRYEPPKAEDHRVALSNGLRCYLVPDRRVPAIRVEAWIDTGELYLPKEKRGLAKLAGGLMRTGGIEGMDARALDARLDAMAAEIEVDVSRDRGHASLWTLGKTSDEALQLFASCLLRPAFADDRIRRAKDELKDEIAHRDDEPQVVLDHEVFGVMYGHESPYALRETVASVDGITREEIVAWHRAHIVPGALILAVSGDFDRAEMQRKLEGLFGVLTGAPLGEALPPVEARAHPGVFVLDRDLNQGYVEMAELGIAIGDPDEVPLAVMNYILGGGSFTSWITKRVRNDEGLAYHAGSHVHATRRHPGLIGASFQSKAPSTAFAAKICDECIRQIREKPVDPDELERAKSSLVDRFPERFATAHGTAAALAGNEFDGRPLDYFATYRQKVAAVTAADVQRVAQAHLHPERLSVVVVGPSKVVLAKDDQHDAALEKLGKLEMLKPD